MWEWAPAVGVQLRHMRRISMPIPVLLRQLPGRISPRTGQIILISWGQVSWSQVPYSGAFSTPRLHPSRDARSKRGKDREARLTSPFPSDAINVGRENEDRRPRIAPALPLTEAEGRGYPECVGSRCPRASGLQPSWWSSARQELDSIMISRLCHLNSFPLSFYCWPPSEFAVTFCNMLMKPLTSSWVTPL